MQSVLTRLLLLGVNVNKLLGLLVHLVVGWHNLFWKWRSSAINFYLDAWLHAKIFSHSARAPLNPPPLPPTPHHHQQLCGLFGLSSVNSNASLSFFSDCSFSTLSIKHLLSPARYGEGSSIQHGALERRWEDSTCPHSYRQKAVLYHRPINRSRHIAHWLRDEHFYRLHAQLVWCFPHSSYPLHE